MQLLKGDKILSRQQCDALRGLAIIGIFLHNFCHWLKGANEENEYTFIMERSQNMWDYWTSGADIFAPIQFFSFFGHYGVPLFLFLSGFGLVMKYERDGSKQVTVVPFLEYHWLKLFRLMFLGLVLSVATYLLCGMRWHGILAYLGQVLMISNVFQGGNITPGPYWFFGLMVEVYVCYRLFIYPTRGAKSRWRWLMPVVLALAAWLLQVLIEGHNNALNYLRYNAVVAMLPFGAGVLVARYGMPKLSFAANVIVALLSLPALALSNMCYHSWLWAPLFVLTGSVAFVKLLEQINVSLVMKPLVWMGAMSSFIFVVHSIPRLPMFKYVLWRQQEIMLTDYWWLLAYVILSILLAWLYKQYLKLIPSPRLLGNGKITFKNKVV